MTTKEYCRMGSLDDVPFKVPLGPLDEPLGMMEPFTAQEIIIPDFHQTLHDLQYDFCLENWVLNGFPAPSNMHVFIPEHGCVLPSCPPYWLLFSSPQERRSLHLCRKGLCDKGQRQRSLSMSSADLQRSHLPRTHFLVDDSAHDAAGYSEDDECSSTEEDRGFRSRSRERARFSLLHEAQRPGSPRAPIHTHRNSTSTLKEMSNPPSLRSPRPHKKHISGCSCGKRSITPHKPHVTHSKLQPRPSSADPQPSTHQRKSSLQAARPRTSHGDHHLVSDSSVELLYALSQEERELVESITAQGYTLRSAILALQRAGTRSAEQILNYLLVRDRLCALGYEKTQVEDALEMFQNCESKATEFLRLLAQFCEMGFQQSTIKEVLLLHDNHRERALEELVTHVT
ncbi:ubiquitin-associated protein 1-like isoform X2 [Ictalurus furcatus]|uniref:ubiquitin-associated protein 1-like isoform X2 n=1 Tax=Ictalurus furcatus TaxID=66913 RepID=UPI0023501FCD|nr:ubiquitin-associated protein 1-like isoform X2 [Ictalurus furcatus]